MALFWMIHLAQNTITSILHGKGKLLFLNDADYEKAACNILVITCFECNYGLVTDLNSETDMNSGKYFITK